MLRAILLHSLLMIFAYGDARATRHIIKGGGHELNPVMRVLVANRAVWYGVKLGGSALLVVQGERARRRGNPRWYAGELSGTVSQGFGATLDMRQIYIHGDHLERKVWFP